MRSLLVPLALVAIVLLSTPALAKKGGAENIDFGSITCGQFVQDLSTASDEDAGVILMWLDGYLSGVSGDPVLDWNNLTTFGEELVTYCNENSGTKMLDAAREVGIR